VGVLERGDTNSGSVVNGVRDEKKSRKWEVYGERRCEEMIGYE
jgi:hypothetical protein